MKFFCLSIIILSLVGCSEKPVHESTHQEKLPELHRVGDSWVLEEKVLSKSDLIETISDYPAIHIIAPESMSYKELRFIWEKSTRKRLKLTLSMQKNKDSDNKDTNSAELHIINDPLAERDDCEPMLVSLMAESIFVGSELNTQSELHERINIYITLAKAGGVTPSFLFYAEDQIPYSTILRFLRKNSLTKFEIRLLDRGCELPELPPR